MLENRQQVRDITLKGEEVMIRIRDLIDRIQAEEQRLLQIRNEANSESAARLNIFFYLLLFCGGLFMALIFVFIRRYTALKRKAAANIKELNASLEKRVEEKTLNVIEQEKRFHFVLDNMTEGVQILDFDWKYLYVNNAFLGHAGQPAADLRGRTMPGEFPRITDT